MRPHNHPALGVLLACVFLLAACGGDSADSDDAFSLSTGSVEFSAKLEEDAPGRKVVTATANGNETARPDVSSAGVAIDRVEWYFTDSSTLRIEIYPVDPDSLGTGTHSGLVTVSSSDETKTIRVTYRVSPRDPAVNGVSPNVSEPGAPQTVAIAGRGFARADSAPDVSFGGVPADTVEVISDTLIKATHPELSRGDYDVTVSSPDVSYPSDEVLYVRPEPAYPASAVPRSGGGVTALEYDPKRLAVYIGEFHERELERYRYDPETMDWEVDSLGVPDLVDIALSADGSQLLVASQEALYTVDPDAATGQMDATEVAEFPRVAVACATQFHDIVALASGNAMLSAVSNCVSSDEAVFLYDAQKQSVSALDERLEHDEFAPSGDGTRVVAVENESDPDGIVHVDGTADTFTNASTENHLREAYLDLDGDVVVYRDVAGYGVYDGEFSELGAIDLPDEPLPIVVAPDGRHAYAYREDSNEIDTIDLTGTDGNGEFPVAATTTLDDTPGGFNPRMAISTRGGTVFIAGDDQLVVWPVPGR